MKEAIIQYNDTPSGGHLAISWKPLVRCKHCKHYEPEDKVCCHPFGAVVGKIPENFYCEYGEREDENDGCIYNP